MTTKRIKLIDKPVTRQSAEDAVQRIAEATNAKRFYTAEMDEQIAKIKANYLPSIDSLDAEIKANAKIVQLWAEQNPEEFAKRKSLAMAHGTIGFRTGTPKLALLNRKWSWDTVLSAVEKILPAFIRPKPEVDKEAIIGQRDELAEFLPLVGLKIVQDESFFIEPNLTKDETRQTLPA